MESSLFPQLEHKQVAFLLSSPRPFKKGTQVNNETVQELQRLGLIDVLYTQRIQCMRRDDVDKDENVTPLCTQDILVPTSFGEDVECPKCDRLIERWEEKRTEDWLEVATCDRALLEYGRSTFAALPMVEEVLDSTFGFVVVFASGPELPVVWESQSEAERADDGVAPNQSWLFEEPVLFVSNTRPRPSVSQLAEKRYTTVASMLSMSASEFEEVVAGAAAVCTGKPSLNEASGLFDEFLEAAGGTGKTAWPAFERLAASFLEALQDEASKLQKLLKQFEGLKGTLLEKHFVQVGGAGRTDIRPISWVDILSVVESGSFLTDAKCHILSEVTSDTLKSVTLHLMTDPTKSSSAIVISATDRVTADAWDVMHSTASRQNGMRVVILSRTMFLVIVAALGLERIFELD